MIFTCRIFWYLSFLILISVPTLAAEESSLAQPIEVVAGEGQDLPAKHTEDHWHRPDGSHLPFSNDEQILEFLRTADIVSMVRIGEGINQTKKVLLEKDGIQMHAAFRDVHQDHYAPDPYNESFIRNHRDDCYFEVAAYKLSKLLGLRLVPPTVTREVKGKSGSMQAWVESAMMERERREDKINPPDEWYWMAQMLTMHLFDNLVGNLDRHQGNMLVDESWDVWLIDHTQAFRRFPRLHSPEKLQYCDRDVWENLQKLDKKTIQREFKGLLRKPEINALWDRRAKIIEQIRKLIEERGENAVLFSLES